ncbi:MAG TPA: hypothetical protein VGA28_03035, partial [Desulfurivibrionaceae bacterium]
LYLHDIAQHRRIVHDEDLSVRLDHFSLPWSMVGCKVLSPSFSAWSGKRMNPFSRKKAIPPPCSMVYGKK